MLMKQKETLYTLRTPHGLRATITNLGGRVVSLFVPDRNGILRDVVLGFENVEDYLPENHRSDFGAAIGRYANRLNNGQITIDGKTYQLPQNDGANCLHGGPDGWQYRMFNVESVRQSADHTQRFPFDQFKANAGNRVTWSLEHIHAQNSEALRKQAQWREWLELHVVSIRAVCPDAKELINEIQDAIDDENLTGETFNSLQEKVQAKLTEGGGSDYIHSISNLALLNTSDNAALNNSTFDVKRNAIIRMDKNGEFIPFCTKMVFLKYYTPSEENQLHFWGHADRVAYVKEINRVLEDYLSEQIEIEREEV